MDCPRWVSRARIVLQSGQALVWRVGAFSLSAWDTTSIPTCLTGLLREVAAGVRTFLPGPAAQRRGSVEYVPPGASVETAIGSITTRIRHPALVNLRIENAPVGLTDLTPRQLPDPVQGAELLILSRHRA